MPPFSPRPRARLMLLLLCGVAATLFAAASAQAAPLTITYHPKGEEQTLHVPADVTSIGVVAVGGTGGAGQYGGSGGTLIPGGRGARVSGAIPVTPGSTLYLEVGANGTDASAGCESSAFLGGGRAGCSGTGGGGGATDIRVCAASASSCPGSDPLGRLLVAGGGGGSAGANANDGGPGGDAGQPGTTVSTIYRGTAGGGGAGTDTAGGAAGGNGDEGTVDPYSPLPATAGTLGQGGAGGTGRAGAFLGGGGGGGGLYGGGGGGSANYYAAGGGGGSSLVPSGGTSTLDSGADPRLELTFDPGPATSVTKPVLDAATVYAGGQAQTTVTVEVRAGDIAIPGQAVTFSATAPAPTFGPVTDHGDGTYSATVTAAATRGASTITAHAAAAQQPDSAGTVLTQVVLPVVTSPADGAPALDTPTGPGTISASGTADPATTAVRVGCYVPSDFPEERFRELAGPVPVTAGTWSVADLSLDGSYGRCRLVALAADVDGDEAAADASGPRLRRLAYSVYEGDAGPQSFEGTAVGLAGEVGLGPFGSCDLSMRELSPSLESSRSRLECAASLTGWDDWADDERPALSVDGHRVFTPYQQWDWGVAPGDPASPTTTLTSTTAADGSLVLTERDGLARCGTAEDDCSTLAAVGVAVTVRTATSPSGTHVQRVYTLESTDGQPHAVTLSIGTQANYDVPEFRVGGEQDYAAHDAPDTVPVGAGPFSVLIRGGDETDETHVATTAAVAPDEALFAAPDRLVQRYSRTVPAAGRVRLGFSLDLTAPDQAVAAAAVQRAAFLPALTITAPAAGATTTDATVTVRGTARPESTVTVAGTPVDVAADGTWSAPVVLAAGANAIEAVETTQFGATKAASITVTYTPRPDDGTPTTPVDPPTPTVPTTPTTPTVPGPGPKPQPAPALLRLTGVPTRLKTASAIAKGVSFKATLGASGASVTAELLGSSKPKSLGKVVRKKVKAGTSTIRVKLSKAAAKVLRKKKTVTIRLKVTAKPRTGAAKTVTKVIVLRR